MIRRVILPAVVALWGFAIVVHRLVTGSADASAYESGRTAGVAFGLLMAVAGGFYAVRGLKSRT